MSASLENKRGERKTARPISHARNGVELALPGTKKLHRRVGSELVPSLRVLLGPPSSPWPCRAPPSPAQWHESGCSWTPAPYWLPCGPARGPRVDPHAAAAVSSPRRRQVLHGRETGHGEHRPCLRGWTETSARRGCERRGLSSKASAAACSTTASSSGKQQCGVQFSLVHFSFASASLQLADAASSRFPHVLH
jgi:hypothetical protein